ncbi:MAG: hypothetical protein MZW92_53850 [Comamonadaceae bacterium]|nr:hypothetical protein [Comamonadaceae bacterium]
MLESAQRIASDYYHERAAAGDRRDGAPRPQRSAPLDLGRRRRRAGARRGRPGRSPISGVSAGRGLPPGPGADGRPQPAVPVVDVASPSAARRVTTRASSDRLAGPRGRRASPTSGCREPLGRGGELIRAAAAGHARPDGTATGVVVGVGAADRRDGRRARGA